MSEQKQTNTCNPENYYRGLINNDGILQSLLSDLDLLPEQLVVGSNDWKRMLVIVAHWKWMGDKHASDFRSESFAAQINGPSSSNHPY